jgi:hypothetical protein
MFDFGNFLLGKILALLLASGEQESTYNEANDDFS